MTTTTTKINTEGIMIFDQYKLAVSPIRKVASTTIREELKTIFPCEYRLGTVLDVPPSYRVVAWIRNPLARAVSFWRHQVRDQQNPHPAFSQYGIMPSMSFEQTITIIAGIPDHTADPHIRSQYYQIPHSIHKREIFMLERISTDWAAFREVIHDITGKRISTSPQHYNATSQGQSWTSEYTSQRLVDIVADRYWVDVMIALAIDPHVVNMVDAAWLNGRR